jgi:TrpR-related protein YerC/YecD
MKTNKKMQSLYKAVLTLNTEEECRKFFRDLLTEAEIKEFANRWQVAKMLDKKVQYDVISKETGMSSTTIARISKWLNNGMGGYKLMLEKLNTQNKNHSHTRLVAV